MGGGRFASDESLVSVIKSLAAWDGDVVDFFRPDCAQPGPKDDGVERTLGCGGAATVAVVASTPYADISHKVRLSPWFHLIL